MDSVLSSDDPWRLSPSALEGNLIAVSRWNARTELPDAVAFADLRFFSTEVADQWSAGAETDRIGHFPYPKRGGGKRQISIMSVRDVVRLRTAVGDVARVTNTSLLPTIYSAKLRAQPPVWYFKSHLYAAFQKAALQLCQYWKSDGMVRTDVSAYYPNLQIEPLLRALWECGCDRQAVRYVVELLMSWQDRDRFAGIPIGPEACAVLGALYLRALDTEFAPLTTGYFRYSDDIIYFFKDTVLADGGIATIKDHLQALGLKTKDEKTFVYRDSETAAEAIRRGFLDYVDGQYLGSEDLSVVRNLFDDEVAESEVPDVVTYAWCLNRLMRPHDPDDYALGAILDRPELMALDPRITADYLIRCAPTNSDAASVMVSRLPSTRRDPAATLHALRYLASAGLTAPQMTTAIDIARDPAALSPVRAWAIEAGARSPRFTAADVSDAVDAYTPEPVRRAAALTLRHLSGQRGRRFVARDFATKYPDTRWSAVWASEVAA